MSNDGTGCGCLWDLLDLHHLVSMIEDWRFTVALAIWLAAGALLLWLLSLLHPALHWYYIVGAAYIVLSVLLLWIANAAELRRLR